MKESFFCLFLILLPSCLFAQKLTYGLNDAEIKMLMGSYMDGECSTKIWEEQEFSWGTQVTGINNGLIIDYSPYLETSKNIYKDYLTIGVAGFFVIKSIQKTNTGQYCLELIDMETNNIPNVAGYIIITFIDSIHIVIDDSKLQSSALSFSRKNKILWKVAGPTIKQVKT